MQVSLLRLTLQSKESALQVRAQVYNVAAEFRHCLIYLYGISHAVQKWIMVHSLKPLHFLRKEHFFLYINEGDYVNPNCLFYLWLQEKPKWCQCILWLPGRQIKHAIT